MIVKRLIPAVLLCLGPLLGSCGGPSESGFSGYVADHWPHWAGGMPEDVPPRPGAPGYDEFIAHGQASPDTAKVPAANDKTATGMTAKPVFQTAPPPATAAAQPTPPDAAAEQAAPPPNDVPPEDSSVVKGGLY
jgi:hypothetical protein